MATDPGFVEAVLDALLGEGTVEAKKMFGEYGLYVDGRMVGLICDNRLLIKAPEQAAHLVEGLSLEPPYPSAKKAYPVIPESRFDDRDWLHELVRLTRAHMPLPKPKPNKAERSKST